MYLYNKIVLRLTRPAACHLENGQPQEQDILTEKELGNRHGKVHGKQN